MSIFGGLRVVNMSKNVKVSVVSVENNLSLFLLCIVFGFIVRYKFLIKVDEDWINSELIEDIMVVIGVVRKMFVMIGGNICIINIGII